MQRSVWVQRLVGAAIGISAASLLLAVAFPHYHARLDTDASVISDADLDGMCGACQLTAGGFSATPSVSLSDHPMSQLVATYISHQRDVPRVIFVVRPVSPRAPPVLA